MSQNGPLIPLLQFYFKHDVSIDMKKERCLGSAVDCGVHFLQRALHCAPLTRIKSSSASICANLTLEKGENMFFLHGDPSSKWACVC